MENYKLELDDEEAIRILHQFPEDERGRVAAKYIVIGDTVVRYAQIAVSEESIQRYFDPVTRNLQTLHENLETTRKQIEDKIPESLKANLDSFITQLTAAVTSLTNLRQDYHELLSPIIPTLAKSSTKGAVSCEAVFLSLQSTFRDDRFEDVASKARFTDILGIPPFGYQPIFIEVKDHSDSVPSGEVDKFWRDLETRQSPIGVFLSIRTPVSTITSDFSIVTNGSRIGIFAVSEAMGGQGHIFGYMMARKILELLLVRGNTITTEKYEWIAKVLNNRIQEFKIKLRDLEKIESSIDKARSEIDQTLQKVSRQISGLRTSLETMIDVTRLLQLKK
jgi:regulator of replication initiation timing